MQFPESWLREYCNPELTTQELADLLTMSGMEVEELQPVAPPFTGIVVAEILTAVRPGLVYRNTARIGATLEQIIAEQLDTVRDFAPDLVHLSGGGNDLFLPAGPKDLPHLLDTLFGTVADTGAQLVTFTLADVWESERMAPMRGLREPMSALNEMIREVAARYDALLVEFWDHPVRSRPEAMSADLIHFTTGAHAVVTTEMVRALSGIIPSGSDRRGARALRWDQGR